MQLLRRIFSLTILLLLSCAADAAPSVLLPTSPANGATVTALTSITVNFSEAVTGVDAADLLINSDGASLVTGSGAGPYVFTFTQPPPGAVNVSFDGNSAIVGQSGSGAFGGAAWAYTLVDTLAPTVVRLTPAAASTVGALTQVEVTFSEVVTGVDATDLTINGTPATTVTGSGFGPYVFTFPQPAVGAVSFAWVAGHGIVDTAAVPNNFAGGGWSVVLSGTGVGSVVINEFLSANGTGLVDENGDQGDWIELKNIGATAVNLAGWALTNDSGDLGQWVFPSRTIAAGGYLVVYASGKNRTPVSGNLHTNFTINENGGYLALVGPNFPRAAVSAFNYPEQRTDYSYGPQVSDGSLRYFGASSTPATAPTPNAANGNSSIVAITPKVNVSVGRGFFKDPFQLVLTCPDATATIRYTTDFTEPLATSTLYSGPISISTTKCIRAVAFSANKVPSLPVTNSYIYLDQLLSQNNTPAGFPNNWGTNSVFTATGGVIPADYEMDTDPLRVDPLTPGSSVDTVKLQRFNDGMRELPLVSIVMPMNDIFNGPDGLYYGSTVRTPTDLSNVQNKNFPNKKCSVEMILPDGSSAFSTTCGIGGHGNASRDPNKNPKHGFQLKFKGDFGPGSLDYPIFTDSQVQQYDDVILRPDFGSSWRHWSDVASGNSLGNSQRTRATRTRDAFIKSTFRDMGHLASHHRFVHLYLNGIYWGVYDFAEQPVEGFVSAYFGGAKADYAIYHEGIAKNGADTVYTNMTSISSVTTNALYDQMKSYLDVTEYIDYVVMQFYAGAQDWGILKNWYAFRRRATAANPTEGKYQFVPWDEENTFLDTTIDRVNSDPNKYGLPAGLHARNDGATGLIGNLTLHPQYRLDFADRVHKHMIAPGGALTYAANVARWQKWQAVLDKPIVAESCRWGDYRRDVHPYSDGVYALYTRESHWLAENTRMTSIGGYFDGRKATVLAQLQVGGLYPATANGAPEFRLNTIAGTVVGTSTVAAGSVIAMNRPGGAGVIYFTTDGSDPHIYYTPTTGATATSVAATAQTYSVPITINGTTTVKSRLLNAGVWSALNEATFAVGITQPAVKITEIMYNPPGGNAYEFLELQNTGATAVDLGSWYFDGIDYYFPPGTLFGPGSRLVLGNNDGATGLFTSRYPGVTVFGYFGGSLDNNGETITLKDATGRNVVSVTYNDVAPWPTTPHGGGYSLEIIDANGDPDSYANWKSSDVLKGTPGQANSALPASALVLNEVLALNNGGVLVGGLPLGYVELKNTGAVSIDPVGWKVETSSGSFVFGAGTSIAAGDFAVVACGNGSGITTPLNGAGGVVRLRNAAGAYVDSISFGNQIANRAIGRVGSGWTLTNPTVAAENTAASLAVASGNLVINEWLSNAAPGGSDWIELYNKNATLPVAISGLYFQTDTQLYRYPALSFVAPLGWLQLFCDTQPGFNQLDFKLPTTGTALSILDSAAAVIDTVSAVNFGTPAQGISRGRTTDGAATFATFTNSVSPGAANYVNSWTGPIINEVLARNTAGDLAPWGTRADWVEIYNPLATGVALDGLKLATSTQAIGAWTFPTGTTIPAFSYLALWCDAARSPSLVNEADMNTALNLGDQSGALYLFNTNGQIVNRAEWGPQIVERSFGLDAGTQKLLATPTRGAVNSAAAALSAVTALKINEWLAAPIAGGDWFEIFNPGVNPVNMSGLYLTDDPSEIGRVKFAVQPLSFIAAGGWVKWEADAVPEAGRNHVNFNLDANAEYLRLSNSDANITPIDVVSFGQQLTGVAQGRIADGGNIQLLLAPTPGASNSVLLAPTIVTPPANTIALQGSQASFNVLASSPAPITYQWRFNLANISNATGAALSLTNVGPASEGNYSVVATNAAGSAASSAGGLTVQSTFAQWAAARGLSGAASDSDGDGISNLAEYFHNLDPNTVATTTDRAALPQFALEPPTGTPLFLTLTYRVNTRAVIGGIAYQLGDPLLSIWNPVEPDVTESLAADPVTGDPRVRVKFSIAPGENRKFLRLQLTP